MLQIGYFKSKTSSGKMEQPHHNQENTHADLI